MCGTLAVANSKLLSKLFEMSPRYEFDRRSKPRKMVQQVVKINNLFAEEKGNWAPKNRTLYSCVQIDSRFVSETTGSPTCKDSKWWCNIQTIQGGAMNVAYVSGLFQLSSKCLDSFSYSTGRWFPCFSECGLRKPLIAVNAIVWWLKYISLDTPKPDKGCMRQRTASSERVYLY